MGLYLIPNTNVLIADTCTELELPSGVPILDVITQNGTPFTVQANGQIYTQKGCFGRVLGPFTCGGRCILSAPDMVRMRVMNNAWHGYPEASGLFRPELPNDRVNLFISMDPILTGITISGRKQRKNVEYDVIFERFYTSPPIFPPYHPDISARILSTIVANERENCYFIELRLQPTQT